jgi:alpha-glucosidase
MLPFTRGIAGPMDYTAGIFDIDLSKYSKDRTRWNGLDEGKTAVHSTLSNQLALMIVLYSPLQMAADLPENYEGHPALSLLKNLPTNWDESKMLKGEIGEYVVMLRKKGNSYYLAGINNEQEKTVRLNFDFLPVQNEYDVEICKDDENAHFEKNPEAYQLERFKVKNLDSTVIKMSAGGGFFIKITENPKN